ncbi:DnaB-like helicase C-terminal domain-containing protein [Streptomyces sp. NPDC093510]|uniref:DnaB-like helicase C-terminal domain-containing protein n=1 Tax=Streptomyces sp. NPDC093510 TaxID=3155199 RepID=UPI00342C2734
MASRTCKKPEKRNDLRKRGRRRRARPGDASAGLDIPVLATSHCNRSPEHRWDKHPMLDDLRESGATTFSADVIVLLRREDAYAPECPRAGEADLIVAKHRQGRPGTVVLAFQGTTGASRASRLPDVVRLSPRQTGTDAVRFISDSTSAEGLFCDVPPACADAMLDERYRCGTRVVPMAHRGP